MTEGRATGRTLRGRKRGGREPHELAATVAPESVLAELVRNLAETVDGQVAYAVPAGRSHVVVESWPQAMAGVVEATGAEPVAGGGTVFVVRPTVWDDAARELLRTTASWLGLAIRLARLRIDHDAADLRERRLRQELHAARTRLARIRDLERRRLVAAITTTTLRELNQVRRFLQATASDPTALVAARRALEELIDNFRAVVRGVYPAMLPDQGPRAALEELAATLPRPVSFSGDLGHRAGWELESGFYHAVAAALTFVADGGESRAAVTVTFGRDDALRARVVAPGWTSVDAVRAALAHDTDRIAALGGDMSCAVTDGTATIVVRLAERLESGAAPTIDERGLARSALYREVRALVRSGQEATDGTQERVRWDAVAERLTMSPRLAVLGPKGTRPTVPSAVGGVTVLAVDAAADRQLADEFVADDGPRGGVDAVLCAPAVASDAFRSALRTGRRRVPLVEADTADAVTRMAESLAARGPVVNARRAVVAMAELVRALPREHPLRWAVERVSMDAHELAELDLLDDLEAGDVLRTVAPAASRLLGANGIDPRSRLGLAEHVGDAEIGAAARGAASWWRAHAEHPAISRRDQLACEVLVRTAEGLLAQAVSPGDDAADRGALARRRPDVE